ncbi:MAG: phosphate signaling complex protein PhoU [Ruminococcaceae bacterium]|nr:phosphate signaling complex protein PhoU [Oscillospiraceae bacterium]
MENALDKQLERLNFNLIEMGALVERAIACAAKGFISQDITNAKVTFQINGEIKAKEKEIEHLAMKLLLRSPSPKQLRQISAAQKMIASLSRIGDQTSDISEITMIMSAEPYTIDLFVIPDMARETIHMAIDSIHSFVHNDINMALSVTKKDDCVDKLFLDQREMLVKALHEKPDSSGQALDIIMVAKYFERIGDHAADVAEWVIYYITGKHTDKF